MSAMCSIDVGRPNAIALGHLVNAQLELLQKLTRVTPAEWRQHVVPFVDGLAQIHEPAQLIVLVILTELWHGAAALAKRQGAPTLASFLTTRTVSWSSATDLRLLCRRWQEEFAWVSNLALQTHDVQARQIVTLIEAHLSERLTLSSLADLAGLPTREVRNMVRTASGMTLRELVRRKRLEAARSRIETGDKIDAVMIEVGWRNRTTFFREFRSAFGLLPKQYRNLFHHAPELSVDGHKLEH